MDNELSTLFGEVECDVDDDDDEGTSFLRRREDYRIERDYYSAQVELVGVERRRIYAKSVTTSVPRHLHLRLPNFKPQVLTKLPIGP